MTLDKFKIKHKQLFDLGVCHIDFGILYTTITINRYVDGIILCPASKLKKAEADVIKMGYTNDGIGRYTKENLLSHYLNMKE